MNNIELKTLNELSIYSFYIPAYQRGYRWTKQEVSDLLNDINEFVPREIKDSEEKTWYCLQPIVIKKREDITYEVIDGQQRLTTIYLILFFLNQDFVENRRDKIFSLNYETRDKSREFLLHPENKDDSNIDFFYINSAYNTIETWFEEKEKNPNFDKNDFRSKLKFFTKVIWYETVETNPITVFARLNIGKISLTNAELIKALFLSSSNFRSEDERRMKLRQIEIANEWDGIENALQNNKLWYFLSDEEKEDNRIEYIFDLINENSDKDTYSAFRFFSSKLSGKTEKEMNENWEIVQAYYQRFIEWFSNRELYHKIGFLLTAKITTVRELYRKSLTLKKSEFICCLNNLITDNFKNQSLLELDYENKNTKSVLLLYNILTMLKNSSDSSYFPFDEFKLNKWNVEHIASQKDATSVPIANRKDWLLDVECYIDQEQEEASELIRRIRESVTQDEYEDDIFNPLFDEITEHFNKYLRSGEDVNSISNLALLDEKTNKGYKNAVFPLKRKYIIDLDKSGGFVPLCTKNVFLKYFSDYPPKVSFWTQDDREKYEKDLVNVLSEYLEVDE